MRRTDLRGRLGSANVIVVGALVIALAVPAAALHAPAARPPAPVVDPADPASALSTLPLGTPAASVDAVRAALDRAADAQALADRLRDAPGIAARFDAVVEKGGVSLDAAAAPPSFASVEDALAALAAGAGATFGDEQRASAASLDRAPASFRAPLVDLLGATVGAQRLRAEAFAELAPEELEYAQDVASDVAAHPERMQDARFAQIAAKVDARALDQAARDVLAAIDRDAPLLQAALPALSSPALALPPPWPLTPCPAGLAPTPLILHLPPLLGIGSPCNELFPSDYIVTLDLGGNDVYRGNAGGTYSGIAPTPTYFSPVAVALDLAGADKYHDTALDLYGVEGAGVIGVGVLVDLQGNNVYHSGLAVPCGATYSNVLTQGSGLLGAGVHVDLGTSTGNTYNSHNTLGAAGCPFPAPYTVAYSQGSGAWGAGFLVDGLQLDRSEFNSLNTFTGRAPLTYLVDHSQGAGTTGVGAFLGVSGRDVFNHHNLITGSQGPTPESYTVRCSQGAGGACGLIPEMPLPQAITLAVPPGPAGVGVFVKLLNEDCYNCYNQLTSGEVTSYRVEYSQGAAGPITSPGLLDQGIFVDATSANRYNTENLVSGTEPSYTVLAAQGAATGVLATGTFVGLLANDVSVLGFGDAFNSFNTVTATATPPATLTIDLVQGAAAGLATAGTFVETTISAARGNVYNSNNTVTGPPPTFGSITRMQGYGALADAGVMVDLDVGLQDVYNSWNVVAPFAPPGPALTIANGLGADSLGVGAFVNAGGGDVYDLNPGTGPTLGPFPPVSLHDVHGAAGLGAALFVDASVPPAGADLYTPLSFGTACSGILGVAVDLLDGPDAAVIPLGPPPGVCLDL